MVARTPDKGRAVNLEQLLGELRQRGVTVVPAGERRGQRRWTINDHDDQPMYVSEILSYANSLRRQVGEGPLRMRNALR